MPFGPDTIKQLTRELLTMQRQPLKACGWETLTVDNTATGKPLASIPTNAIAADIIVESTLLTPAIRFLYCGNTITTVTSSVGLPRSNGDIITVIGRENLENFRAIQVAAGTHSLSIQYFK